MCSYYTSRVPSYWSGNGRLPSYFSDGNPPSYHLYQPVDRINCPLEDYIFENLDYILILILFCVLFLLIRKLIISNKLFILIYLFVLFLGIIYIQFGLLVLTQVIILFIIMILSNLLLGLNPYCKWLYIIKIMTIILIIFVLYHNSGDISIAFMAPLSISKISYIDDLDIPVFADFESEKIKIFNKFTFEETNDFLMELEDNESFFTRNRIYS